MFEREARMKFLAALFMAVAALTSPVLATLPTATPAWSGILSPMPHDVRE
jgi:hypothetical protein